MLSSKNQEREFRTFLWTLIPLGLIFLLSSCLIGEDETDDGSIIATADPKVG